MRRMFVIIMIVVVLALSLVGCTESIVPELNSNQEELISYFNVGLQELAIMETKMITSYESVRGNNYVSDAVMHKELTTNTVILARELNDKALSMAIDIEDPKLLEIHKKYMEYTTNMLNAINLMISALENQDRVMITQANQVLSEANMAALEYKNELLDLAEEYNVKFKDK